MKKVLFLGHLLAVLTCAAIPKGIYTEYKCTLLNGDKGKDFTFNGKAFLPSLQYNFEPGERRLKITDGGVESENVYSIVNDMLIVKRIVKARARIDTFIYKFEIVEKRDELILSEYRDGFDEDHYLKKHYFKKGIHPLPANEKSVLNIYTTVEEMPEFPGGVVELNKFISKNLDTPGYTESSRGIAKVYVKLLIAPSGKIEDARILVYPKIKLAREAMRVIKKLPDFSPGKHEGKPVYVYYSLPLTFRS